MFLFRGVIWVYNRLSSNRYIGKTANLAVFSCTVSLQPLLYKIVLLLSDSTASCCVGVRTRHRASDKM